MADKEFNETREPFTTIEETEEGANLIVELPGVPKDGIQMTVSGDVVTVDAEGTRGRFRTIQVLPIEPDPDRIAVTYSQGILEVTLRKKVEGKEAPEKQEITFDEEREDPQVSLGSMERELEQMKSELEKVSEERSSLEERVNFLRRDFHNLKRRHQTEKESLAEKRVEEIAHGLVDVLDSFSLAKDSIRSSKVPKKNLESVMRGLEMVEKQVNSLFSQVGVSRLSAEGQHFDPRFHEALGYVERKDLEDDAVAEEVKKGYMYKERCLRPAQVIVNRAPRTKKDKRSSKEKGRKDSVKGPEENGKEAAEK